MIPLFQPFIPENIQSEINTTLYSGQLAFGKEGNAFEQLLNQWLETQNALVVSSYDSALSLLLDIYGLGADDEVVLSPLCCLRSSQPLARFGAKVVWVDIDPMTGTMSPESLIKKITSKTKLIMNYHHLGYVGYSSDIYAIGKRYGIPVIDDCLDGIGGIDHGKKAGTTCDASVFSFDAVRLPNTIEGGGIWLSDDRLVELAKLKRDLGIDRSLYRDERKEARIDCDIAITGYACKLNEVNSLLGKKQMPILNQLLNTRKKNADFWINFLSENQKGTPLKIVNGTVPNYWVFGLLVKNKIESIDHFRQLGYWASGVHVPNSYYSLFGKEPILPGVQDFYNHFIALPCPCTTCL